MDAATGSVWRRYRWWLRGLLVSAPLLGLLLAEAAARLVLPYPPSNLGTYQVDPRFMYFHRPNSVGWEISPYDEHEPVRLAYNSHGFRGEDFPAAKPAGEIRCFLLGDSYVEARQVAEGESLSARLAQELGGAVRVVNAGCSAFTTTTEFLLLKHQVQPLEPDMALLLFACNDYCDNYWYGRYCEHPEAFERGLPPELMPTAYYSDSALRERSLIERVRGVSALLTWMHFRANRKRAELQPWQAVIDSQELRSSPLRVHNRDLTPEDQAVVDFTHQGIVEMQRLCAERRIPFLVAILPFPMQVDRYENRPGKLIWGYADDQLMEETFYQERLLAFCRANKIPCLDLLPAFRQAPETDRLFLDYDGHLAPAGHALAAREFARALREFEIYPPRLANTPSSGTRR